MCDFGVCVNVNGVLGRGHRPLANAKAAVQKLFAAGKPTVPLAFLSNTLALNRSMAAELNDWLDVPVTVDQLVLAQDPLQCFGELHEKRCLMVGQGELKAIAKELGFRDPVTVEEMAAFYPHLDDGPEHRYETHTAPQDTPQFDHDNVEVVIVLGEPLHWECALQVVGDLLHHAPTTPVMAANLDMRYSSWTAMPRFGAGSFLVCLEALCQKHTGRELEYAALVGKPSEITFRYAEHVLTKQAKSIGIDTPLTKMYVIGDVPEVDVVGANLYQRTVPPPPGAGGPAPCLPPPARRLPADAEASLHPRTVTQVHPVLVCTGVYHTDHGAPTEGALGHRDFDTTPELYEPHAVVGDVLKAIEFILDQEELLK